MECFILLENQWLWNPGTVKCLKNPHPSTCATKTQQSSRAMLQKKHEISFNHQAQQITRHPSVVWTSSGFTQDTAELGMLPAFPFSFFFCVFSRNGSLQPGAVTQEALSCLCESLAGCPSFFSLCDTPRASYRAFLSPLSCSSCRDRREHRTWRAKTKQSSTQWVVSLPGTWVCRMHLTISELQGLATAV